MSRRGTVKDYAYWRGVRPSTIYNAIKAGRVPIGGDKMIDFEAADKQWDASHENAGRGGDRRSERYRKEKEQPEPPTEDVSLADAKKRTEILRADLLEIKKAELDGKLIRRDLVQKTEFSLGKSFRDAIEQRAVHIAPLVAGKTDLMEIETIIRTEIRAGLAEAADRAEQTDFAALAEELEADDEDVEADSAD